MKTSPDPAQLAKLLENWFRGNGKDYPWRRTEDPYAILVSEIMLQQTQIRSVLDRGYYERWLKVFPDFAAVAATDEATLLKTWEGLGYYRRARNLQKLAQVVVSEHGGSMPADPETIRSLPGIGPYTAGAVASFAFNQAEPIVDGNVARVLSRVFDDATPIDSKVGQESLWKRARELVEEAAQPRHLNSALMELGQTHCRPGTPDCTACPLRSLCRTERAAELPVKKPRPKPTEIEERCYLLQTEKGVLLEQEQGSRRTGMWKLPSLPDQPGPRPPVLLRSRYGITRYKVTLWVHACPNPIPKPLPGQCFHPPEALADLPMPSPLRRALVQAIEAASAFRLQ